MRLKPIIAALLTSGMMTAAMALPMGLVSHAADRPDFAQSHVGASAQGQDQNSLQAREGTVTAVSATSLTLATQGDSSQGQTVTGETYGQSVTGQTYTYTFATPFTIVYRGQPLSASALTVGSQVNVHLNATGQVSVVIVQKLDMTVSGTVVAVNKGHRVTVREANGTEVVVKVKEKAAITGVGGVSLNLNQLAVGDAVTFMGVSQDNGLMATSVNVTMMVTTSTTTATSSDHQEKSDVKGQVKGQDHSKDQADVTDQSKGKDHGKDNGQSLQANLTDSTSLSFGQDN